MFRARIIELAVTSFKVSSSTSSLIVDDFLSLNVTVNPDSSVRQALEPLLDWLWQVWSILSYGPVGRRLLLIQQLLQLSHNLPLGTCSFAES